MPPLDSTSSTAAFRYHSAQAKIAFLDGGVSDVTYSGVMGLDALATLHAQVMSATRGAAALVVQFDRAIMLDTTSPLEAHKRVGHDAPACWIVPDALLESWRVRAEQMTAQGFMRIVFSRQQAALAYALAGDMAAARQGWPAGRSDSPAASSVSLPECGQTSDQVFPLRERAAPRYR